MQASERENAAGHSPRRRRIERPRGWSGNAVLLAIMMLAPLAARGLAAQQPGGHEHAMHGMTDSIRIPAGALYTAADVRFMQGMIAHHAQAIVMSRLAAARGASPRVLRFATKIDQSQLAEIGLMQQWLRRNGQQAPDTSSWRTMQMPGMLTAAQLEQLGAARDAEFDRRFLTLMIQHHQGALAMVTDLFADTRNAQDVDVSVFANDVHTVQTAEIGIMQQLLEDPE